VIRRASGYIGGMPATPTLLAGRYRLGESLGRGGMGQVWLARDETLDRDVAIKEIDLPDELIAGDRDVVQRRTLREARAAARLSHPHVVQVYDVVEADDRTWIVMEHVPSRSLQQVITADGPLPDDRVARIGLDLLAALEAAHRAGVWHRDVKPANVLLGEDGRVVLSDFGIATIEGDALVTGSGLVIGSPEYMPPERARAGTAGPAADLWSLGATLYAAVEGRSPYRRGSVLGTLTALAAEEPDPPRRAGALRPVLDGLLRTDPQARTDFAETRRRLRAAAGEPDDVPEPPAAAGRPVRTGPPVPAQRRPDPPARGVVPTAAMTSPATTPPTAAASPPAAASLPAAASPPAAASSPAAASPSGPASPPDAASPVAAASPPAAATSTAATTSPASTPATATSPPPPTSPPSAAEPAPARPDAGSPATTASRRSRRLAVVALALVVALVAAGVGWFVLRPDTRPSAQDTPGRTTTGAPAATGNPGNPGNPGAGTDPGAGTAPATPPPTSAAAPTTGGTAAPSAVPSGQGNGGGTAARPALPRGWREHRDRTGFSVYVPSGWRQSREGSIVYFRDSRGGRVLGIDQTDRPKADPVADWRGQAAYRVERGDFPGYDQIRISSVRYWQKAADWEFTFNGGNRRHVNNRGFVVSKNKAYGIYWQTSDAEWDEARDDLQLVFDSFRPARS
jgi:serine/threonine protein kinase